jgi:two-component system, LytTR family, response regulator LytT
MYRIVIIEDEKYAASFLKNMLQEIAPDMQVVAVWESIETATNQLLKTNPDLILADIQLEDGVSFSIFEQIHWQKPVIFITAYDSYALRAFKLNSIDYLLKPIEEEALQLALEKFRANSLQTNLESLQEKLSKIDMHSSTFKERFAITIGTRLYSISVNEIAYFVYEQRSVTIITQKGQKFPYTESLDHLIAVLNPIHFFRINRNYIINHNAIDNIEVYAGRSIIIKLNPLPREGGISVSKDRITEFKAWLDK